MDIGIGSNTASLEDRFTAHDAPVLLSGIQALVRVPLEQARLDAAAGHHTAGFISGYRGSPLGGLDQELWRQKVLLEAADVRFQPGLNEDLAATMLWGTQQLAAFPGQRFDGVFGMWYGKGPGVDRSGDAFRCANMLGTSALGGVLAVSGDDHAAQSSVVPHQTDHIFQSVMMPILHPADVADILEFGLAGIALSRFSGLWVALKTIAETAEQSATTIVPGDRRFVVPGDFEAPAHGLNFDPRLSFPGQRAELERRVIEERLPAVGAFARANRVDRLVFGAADAPVGIVTVGKAHHDAMHALRLLGLRGDPRIAVYKVGLTWPIEAEGLRRFAAGRRVLLVVEEKRSFVEAQLREALYNLPADARPSVLGKTDLAGATLLPAVMEFGPEIVAAGLVRALAAAGIDVAAHVAVPAPVRDPGLLTRTPAFCAGCPHGTSTQLPEGSFANAGIGCHFLALAESDSTRTFSQMGGEGVSWVGMAPFTDTPHMFVNLGDGTYQHSGILAIRQAVAVGTNVTYKILYNDAVAMTGGQPVEGSLTVQDIARQVSAEGVKNLAVVADDPARLPAASTLPAGTELHGRDDLDAVQRKFREQSGVGVIIYDQVCATEKRRRRKRGKMAQAERQVQINESVCENCGDCSVQSSCIAIEPVETELGRKRRISPTACNVDLSCLKGFCPSFVTLAGPPAAPELAHEWIAREEELAGALPEPVLSSAQPWRGLFAGIGGGGIVTSGAIVAMAAQLEGWQVSRLDFTGLAQKNGAVVSHVQIGRPGELDVVRIPLAEADMMLAADLAVGAAPGVLDHCAKRAGVVGNLDLAATAAFKHDRDLRIDGGLHRRVIERATPVGPSRFLHAAQLSERLFGNAQAMNQLLLGMAWQLGQLPLGRDSLFHAIELNGAAISMNHRAFTWGRILADRPELAEQIMAPAAAPAEWSFAELVDHRVALLTAYQGKRYAAKYRRRVDAVAQREAAVAGAPGALARAAAEGWFRVMYMKDEYEVARLHTETGYDPARSPVFHLAPPLITRVDKATGRRRKIAISGRVALPLFRVLRFGRVLRGTVLDPFGLQADRRMERAMVAAYEQDMGRVLGAANLDAAVRVASWPMDVRGYGPVKHAAWVAAEAARPGLLAALDAPAPMAVAAE